MPGSLQARASRVQGPATRPWRCSSWPKHRGSCRASSDTPGLGTTHGLCPLFPRPCRCLGGRGGGPWPAPRCPGRLPPPLTYCGGRTPTPQSTAGRPASGLLATGRSAPRRTRSPAVLRSPEGTVGCPEKGRASSQQCLPGRTTHEHTRSHPRNAERGTRDAHPRTRACTHTPRPGPSRGRPGSQAYS